VDSVREQEKLEARKLLAVGGAEFPGFSAPVKMGESHHFIRENGGLYKSGQKKCRFYLKKAQFCIHQKRVEQ